VAGWCVAGLAAETPQGSEVSGKCAAAARTAAIFIAPPCHVAVALHGAAGVLQQRLLGAGQFHGRSPGLPLSRVSGLSSAHPSDLKAGQ
jgi:hypothetical protein